MSQVFDPYSSWLGIPARDHRPDHYALLGLRPFEADLQAIRRAADRQQAAVRRHETGEHAEVSQRIQLDLAAATECLLNPEKKAAYDNRLREAQDMGDTRSMSCGDLDAKPDIAAGDGPSWQMDPGGAQPSPEEDRPIAAESTLGSAWSDADSAAWADDSSRSDASAPDLELPARPVADRRPVIAVILIASTVGVFLVGLFAVVAALTGRRPSDTTNEGRLTAVAAGSATSPGVAGDRSDLAGQPDAARPLEPPTGGEPEQLPAAVVVRPDETNPEEIARLPTDPANVAAELNPVEDGAGSVVDTPVALPPPERLPVPPAGEQLQLAATIDAALGIADFGTRREKLDLAEQLIEAARDPGHGAALRYALLLRAVQLAGPLNDSVLTLTAADRLRAGFDIPEDAFERLLGGALGGQIDPRRDRQKRFIEARRLLERDPADPPANTELGRYYCFERDDWRRGLPFLAQGENTALRLLAEDELIPVETWQQRLDLGHGWWAISEVADGDEQAASQERAAHWYRLALPDLDSADKRRVQSRLASLIALPATGSGDQPPEDDGAEVESAESAESVDHGAVKTPAPARPANLTGIWRSDRFQSVFRLHDNGQTVRCELVSSRMVRQVDGLWVRDQGKLVSDRWRFRFVEDPQQRFWDLECEPEVIDETTIRLKAEVVVWDRQGREIKRQMASTLWRKQE